MMSRFVFIISVVIGILTLSCGSNKKEESIKNIQGDWVFDTAGLPNIGTGRIISKIRDNCGFEFQSIRPTNYMSVDFLKFCG
ncbi:hypothetical protein SPPR111872_12535 [Sphingobacterium prati]